MVDKGSIANFRMMKYADVLVAAGIIGIVMMMVIPLPPVLMDLLLSLNLTFSIVVLLMTMYTLEPLEFSIFPSLLLVTTLFRLALNVASTRLILLHGYAGEVIQRFGEFVVGGNPVVGFIVFCILVIIQFIVITRGAERVAEVAARFTLDAMPGKQMSIDADLNAGLIDDNEARKRRADIEREADFYGAMDGASKFVKGDAIAGLVIIVINLLGGFVVGMVQGKMSFMEALQHYSLLTVGDGLVTQIPALLISTATGIVVTRAASESHMGQELLRQVLSHPRVLLIATGLLVLLGLVPGLPQFPFFILAGAIGATAYAMDRSLKRKSGMVRAPAAGAAPVSRPEDVLPLLSVDPLEIELGYGLICLVDSSEGGDLLERIVMIRKRIATELGFVVPPVRVRDNVELPPNSYVIKLKGVKIAEGELLVNYLMAIGTADAQGRMDGIPTKEPAFQMDALWIKPEERISAEIEGFTVVEPSAVLATHLSEVIKSNAHELLGRQEVKNLLDNLKEQSPAVVEEVVPDLLSVGQVQRVLQKLLKEEVPIRDMPTIMETLGDYARVTKDVDVLTEYVRRALSRTICSRFKLDTGKGKFIILAPDVEDAIIKGVQHSELGAHLSIEPALVNSLIRSLEEHVHEAVRRGIEPMVLCSPVVRPHFKRLTESVIPRLPVFSYAEIDPTARIETIGVISVENPEISGRKRA